MGSAAPVAAGLLAACLASAGAAAETSNSLYGNFRYSVNHAESNVSADSNASRLGLRGEAAGTGLTAFYHLESGVDVDVPDLRGRFYYAGLKGTFGEVTVGRHSTAYKMAGLALDPFYDTSAPGPGGRFGEAGAAGATFGNSALTNGWAANGVSYVSPGSGPLALNAAVYIDDGDGNDHHFATGATYVQGPYRGGIQYYRANGGQAAAGPWAQAAGVDDAVRAHGSVATGPLTLGLSLESVKDAVGDTVRYLYLGGSYKASDRTRLSASVGAVGDTGLNANEGVGINLGVFHALLPNATVYGLVSRVDLRDAANTNVVSVGFVYDFDLRL